VRYLGFIPDQDMSALYREAAGLVMPTFLLKSHLYGVGVRAKPFHLR